MSKSRQGPDPERRSDPQRRGAAGRLCRVDVGEDVPFHAEHGPRGLAELGEGEQVARINSGGSQVWAGEAIRSIIAGHPGGVRMIVEGIAASSASLLLMGAARREMTAGALLMIHDPSGIVLGTRDDYARAAADGLGVAADTYAAVCAAASARPDEVRRIMKAETWYSPQGAVEAGFADTVLDMEGDAPAARPRTAPRPRWSRHGRRWMPPRTGCGCG